MSGNRGSNQMSGNRVRPSGSNHQGTTICDQPSWSIRMSGYQGKPSARNQVPLLGSEQRKQGLSGEQNSREPAKHSGNGDRFFKHESIEFVQKEQELKRQIDSFSKRIEDKVKQSQYLEKNLPKIYEERKQAICNEVEQLSNTLSGMQKEMTFLIENENRRQQQNELKHQFNKKVRHFLGRHHIHPDAYTTLNLVFAQDEACAINFAKRLADLYVKIKNEEIFDEKPIIASTLRDMHKFIAEKYDEISTRYCESFTIGSDGGNEENQKGENQMEQQGGEPEGGEPDGGEPEGKQPDRGTTTWGDNHMGGQPHEGQPDGATIWRTTRWGEPEGETPDGGEQGGNQKGGTPDGGKQIGRTRRGDNQKGGQPEGETRETPDGGQPGETPEEGETPSGGQPEGGNNKGDTRRGVQMRERWSNM